MPHFSYNIPFTISYGSIFSELLLIASCTLRINDFLPRASNLFSRMIKKGGNKAALTKELKTSFQRCPNIIQKFGKIHKKVNISIVKNIL